MSKYLKLFKVIYKNQIIYGIFVTKENNQPLTT